MRFDARRILWGGLALAAGLMLPGLGLAQDASYIYTYKGADRAQKILEGAKKEGMVTLYSGMIVNQALRPMGDGFGKRYPDVRFEFFRGDTRELTQKITVEQRNRKQIADVVESTGVAGPTIKAGAAQPYFSPASADYAAHHVSKEGWYVASRLSYFGMAYNTRKFSEQTVPKTYDALLDPKYKDALSWRAQSESGSDLFIAAILRSKGEKAGEDYLRALGKQNVVNYTGSARALVDRVGQGEYDLALNIFAHHPLISKAIGAPLDVQMLEPIPSVFGTVLAIKGAPHPHAAMLFIDYMLSLEAQTVLQAADYFSPHPAVEADPKLAKVLPKNAKMKELAMSSEELIDDNDRIQAMYEKYFK